MKSGLKRYTGIGEGVVSKWIDSLLMDEDDIKVQRKRDAVRNLAETYLNAPSDMVSYLGWEWTNGNKDNVPSHYGHKNVIFRAWEPGQTPSRPIAGKEQYFLSSVPPPVLGVLSLYEGVGDASDFGWYVQESKSTPTCPVP